MTKSWTDTLEDVLHGTTFVVEAVKPYLPPNVAAPVTAVEVVIAAADGTVHRLSKDGVEQVQARETEAGRSISKASHLAGLREAIEKTLDQSYGETDDSIVDAIMVEVARRMP